MCVMCIIRLVAGVACVRGRRGTQERHSAAFSQTAWVFSFLFAHNEPVVRLQRSMKGDLTHIGAEAKITNHPRVCAVNDKTVRLYLSFTVRLQICNRNSGAVSSAHEVPSPL